MNAIGSWMLRAAAGVTGVGFALALGGCAAVQEAPVAQPGFTAVQPVVTAAPREATGSIYNGRQSDNWFGRGRNFAVGDVIMVLLDERMQGTRSTSTSVNRESSNNVLPTGLINRVQGLSPLLGGAKLDGGTISSEGTGSADQTASLSGSLAVSVVEVLANGNLVVRGEKQLSLSEGSEIIQVSGVIRPQDISPNNTVLSRRLAHSQIAYRGSGDLAAAARPGWATRALTRIWPF